MTITSIFLKAVVFCTSAIVGVDDETSKYEFAYLDGMTAAKMFAVAYVLQGLIVRCFPATNARWYGWGDSPTIEYVMMSHGDTVLFTGIGATCILLLDWSVCRSIGAMHAANIVSQGLVIFDPKFKQFRNTAFFVVWVSTMFGAYAGLAETSWCTSFYKVLATFHALIAAQMVFFPSAEAVYKMLNLPPSTSYDDNFLALVRGMSLFYLGLEAFGLMVLYGEDAALALGCASLFGIVHFIDSLFVTKTARKQTRTFALNFAWLLFFCIMTPLTFGLVLRTDISIESQTQ